MLSAGDSVVVGVSGGADSVCLLLLLCEYAKTVPLKLQAVHVDHGIRPEAMEDAAFVEKLCAELCVPYTLVRADVPQISARRGISLEEAGREARYEAFSDIAEQNSAKIAVAHNLNDRGETVLFHLFRGTGMKGLGGIRPVRDNVLRPLLVLTRAEIEEYLALKQRSFCQDRTNDEDDYTRNRIRHHILPYAEQEICKGSTEHLAKCAEQLTEAQELIDELTAEAFERCVTVADEGELQLDLAAFEKERTYLQKCLLHLMLAKAAGEAKDLGTVHVEELLDICRGRSGRSVDLPGGVCAVREFGRVVIRKRAVDPKEAVITIPLPADGEHIADVSFIANAPASLVFRVFSREKGTQVPTEQYTKQFDYDKIKGTLQIRRRRSGDYLPIRKADGTTGRKSLKEFMIDLKIPAGDRDRIPVIAVGSRVIWLVGYRIGEDCKLDESTRRVLQIEWRKN